MPQPCIELVVHTVKDARDAGAARRAVRPRIDGSHIASLEFENWAMEDLILRSAIG